MTHEGSAPAPELVPGLPPDGQFLVKRSSGAIEQGWSVARVRPHEYDDGKVVQFATIYKPQEDDPTRGDYKTIAVDRLLSWQQPETETAVAASAEHLGSQVLGRQENFDHLFVIDESDEPADKPQAEIVKNPRLEKIFAPQLTVKEAEAAGELTPHTNNYDHLLMEDGPARDAAMNEHARLDTKRKMEELQYTKVTDESRSQAAQRLRDSRFADPEINKILAEYQSKNPVEGEDLVDAVRRDADLRYRLGDYLYSHKLAARIHRMPDRVRRNDRKNPNHRGYSKINNLRSPEYAVMVALAMLDGTYTHPLHDPIQRNDDGEVLVGQHRSAAEELLY